MIKRNNSTPASLLMLCFSLVFGGSLAKNLKMINNATPLGVNEVPHPFVKGGSIVQPSPPLQLALYHEEANLIVDEEDWFDRNGLSYPEAIDAHVAGIPPSTRFGDLKFLRSHTKRHYAIYETVFLLKTPKDIYDEGHHYALVVFDTAHDTLQVFILDALFPDILEMCWFEAIDDLVYFNATYNGYADIRDNKTGYLYCLDTTNGGIKWATKNLISSYCGFTAYKDHLLTGYGFTAEPDFLYIVDRFNGDVTQTIPIKTAHEHIIIKNEKCYVRTYNMNYIFTIEE
ncbi:hypothetical protein JXB22_04305 [candidate division WOR-3 bacterium]|nr:hypothetical protein [candidate division WOR-3 bacterium]